MWNTEKKESHGSGTEFDLIKHSLTQASWPRNNKHVTMVLLMSMSFGSKPRLTTTFYFI